MTSLNDQNSRGIIKKPQASCFEHFTTSFLYVFEEFGAQIQSLRDSRALQIETIANAIRVVNLIWFFLHFIDLLYQFFA